MPGMVLAQPNVLNGGNYRTTFTVNASPTLTLKVKVYTMAGELMWMGAGATGGNSVQWDVSQAASGLYLGVVEGVDAQGNKAFRQILKVMVVR